MSDTNEIPELQNTVKTSQTLNQELLTKIFITKKARIEAATRCKYLSDIFTIIEIVTTVVLILIQLVQINTDSNSIKFSIFSISTAITLFALTFIKRILDFEGKYYVHKQTYNKLQELEIKGKTIDENQLNQLYVGILSDGINHAKIDYQKVLLSDNYLFDRYIFNALKYNSNNENNSNSQMITLTKEEILKFKRKELKKVKHIYRFKWLLIILTLLIALAMPFILHYLLFAMEAWLMSW